MFRIAVVKRAFLWSSPSSSSSSTARTMVTMSRLMATTLAEDGRTVMTTQKGRNLLGMPFMKNHSKIRSLSSRSWSTDGSEEEEEEEEEEKGDIIGVDVKINKDRSILSIGSDSSDSSDSSDNNKDSDNATHQFHASWLYVQDPKAIHPSSGQRLRTLGQYSPTNHRIQHASFLLASTLYNASDDNVQEENEKEEELVHPIPPPGSYHPRGNIYDDETIETDSKSQNSQTSRRSDRVLLRVKWANGEQSIYDWKWLAQFTVTKHDPRTETTTKITPDDVAIGNMEDPTVPQIPKLDYERILNTNQGLWEALHGIMEFGAVLVQKSPIRFRSDGNVSDCTVADLGKRLSGGRLSHGSLYGDTFHVVSQPHATNIAYTTVALPPHQDLTYYESKPFLQLLQCVTNAGSGGASILIDAMAAAEYLRSVSPDLFETLCHVEATFLKQRPGADMVSFKPHIVTSYDQVVQVNWSPPFEGPMMMLEAKEMEEYTRAYQALSCLLDNQMSHHETMMLDAELQRKLKAYAQKYTWEKALHPGDLLIFNNQRMCHGRRGFELKDGQTRHLMGCYTDAMETINNYRMLFRHQRRRNDHYFYLGDDPAVRVIRNAGNGSRGCRI